MNSPWTKAKVSEKRRRNFVAKRLREDRRFRPRVNEGKNHKDEDWKKDVEEDLTEVYGNQEDCY